jgi:hypothetical protein
MNETVKENITKDIYQTLANISAIDGYNNEAVAERQQQRGNVPKDRLLLIMDEGDSPADVSPLNKDDYNASYSIKCFVAISDSPDATPDPDVVVGRLVADVRMALMQDYSRGGWAINTTPGDASALPSNERGGYRGAELRVEILYRTAQYDPYSQ